MDERGGVSQSDASRWNGTGGVPEPALEALAASWRQPVNRPTPRPEGRDDEDGPELPPARGRAEVRPFTDQLPPPYPANGSAVAPVNGQHVHYDYQSVDFPPVDYPRTDHRLAPNAVGYFTPVREPLHEPGPSVPPPAAPPLPPQPSTDPRGYVQVGEAVGYTPTTEYGRHAGEDPASPWAPTPPSGYVPAARSAPPPQYQEAPPSYAEQFSVVPAAASPTAAVYQPEPPPGPSALPQRVPAEPDVPPVPEDVDHERTGDGPPAEAPDLTRIADYLRDEDEEIEPIRPDGFDIPAVLAAVRDVPGVREAQLRPNPGGVHTLRLELADDADPGRVSREVARLLKERMGLAAEPRESREAAAGAVAGGLPAPVSVPVGPTARHHEPAPEHSLTREPPPLRETRRRHGVPATRRATDPVRLHREVPPRPLPGGAGGPRVRLDRVEIGTQGTDAMVEVRLTADGTPAYGVASGPAFDGYVLRLAAVAAANAVDELLTEPDGSARARCYVEHAAVVPFGTVEVAVVVMLLACGGWVEQLSGSALVGTDPQNAVVRATLDAVNRRLEALLP